MAAPSNNQSVRGPIYLVGDVGGTRTRLALYDAQGRSPVADGVFPSQEHVTFEEIVETFLESAGVGTPVAAVIGVAGPVSGGIATITNLPWRLEEKALEERLGIGSVKLANDLVVGARGCLEVDDSELIVLTEKSPVKRDHNIGVIAAGTGLGEARLLWLGDRYHALPTEGGHTDYAPRSALEIDLWNFLSNRFLDHVSNERVLSGAGLGAIYDFFVARGAGHSKEVAKKLASGDRNAMIAELGLAREDQAATQAVELFAFIYGAEAGNIALRELAVGGVYILGNIAATILPKRREIFLEGFKQKGRFASMLAAIPVAIVNDSLVGLRGALAMARGL